MLRSTSISRRPPPCTPAPPAADVPGMNPSYPDRSNKFMMHTVRSSLIRDAVAYLQGTQNM